MKQELPESAPPVGDGNEQLRQKVELLEREVERLQKHHAAPHIEVPQTAHPRPRAGFLRGLVLGLILLFAVLLGFGLLPKIRRQRVLAAEAEETTVAKPIVPAAVVMRAPAETSITLPGSMQPITEAPVLARASGYIKRRFADIGDRVSSGQVLALIEAPELDQQVNQAAASLSQASAALEQAKSNLAQGIANRDLAHVSATRYGNLEKRGIVSHQESDTYQAQFKAQDAAVDSLQKAVAAAQSNIGASEASLARLKDLRGYLTVRAPFAGVVTLRNVDSGTLVTESSTLLFRVAQTGVLRTYINAPQMNASEIRPGQVAQISLNELPGKVFNGKVARSAGSLDPATRTLLVEVQVANPKNELMPGMYANVTLRASREDPPLLIPSEALIARGDGTLAAVVDATGTVHFQTIQVGRDSGTQIEVLAGLQEGMKVVVNPNDKVREGVVVETRPFVIPHVGGAPAKQPAAVKKAD